ncbi:hypothetical protein QQ045_018870 [Rhodiola kirilowii]
MQRDKARLSWLKEGDRNSKLFHAAMRVRRFQNRLQLDIGEGEPTSDRDVIGERAVAFFQDLFQGYSSPPGVEQFDMFEKVLTDDDNAKLVAVPDADEVLNEIKGMGLSSAPGPDGFTGQFFLSCWDIVRDDVMKAMIGFFQGMQIPKSISSTLLVLIPKVPQASSISQLRPISLCNFVHKIFSRILMSRLAVWLPRLISEEQGGFVAGRSIHENIALAHDLVHDLNQKRLRSNVVIKLDMSKAYDRVSWSFIMAALRGFGFSEGWCDLIYRCISNCFYSVRWDGRNYGFFKSMRGVRQGDPLSSGLFVVAMEWLSRAMKKAVGEGRIYPYFTKAGVPCITHQLFADDILIFTNGCKNSVRELKGLIDKFCLLSGQLLNPDKSIMIFSDRIKERKRADLLQLTGFKEGRLPQTYLGAPLYKGITLIAYFDDLVNRLLARIKGWASHFLSMSGRIVLVNSVLNAMAIHSMICLPVPLSILDRMTSLMASFVWDAGDAKRKHWIGWERLCRSREEGGLGLKNPRGIMHALHGKLAWSYIQNKTLWARHAHARFKVGDRGSSLWGAISPLIEPIRRNSEWMIGRGNITIEEFCDRLDMWPPVDIVQRKLNEVLADRDSLDLLLDHLPQRVQDRLKQVLLNDNEDRFVWRPSSKGEFEARVLWKLRQSTHERVAWGSVLWWPWIPPKVSCFLWRTFHNILPTDDNVQASWITLASKCRCCREPSQESVQHLLFDSDWGKDLWSFLGGLFGHPQIHSLQGMLRVWLHPKKPTFMECLAFAMAGCGMWEVWKARNKITFDGKEGDWKLKCKRWAPMLARMISKPYIDSMSSDLILSVLRIRKPGMQVERWHCWRPGEAGYTMNIGWIRKAGRSVGGAVIRSKEGRFCMAFKSSYTQPNEFKALIRFIDKALEAGAGRDIRLIQGSHPLMTHLQRGDDRDVPMDFLEDRRRFQGRWWARVLRVIPMRNDPALALAWSEEQEDHPLRWDDLSLPVRRGLRGDFMQLEAPASPWRRAVSYRSQEDHIHVSNRWRLQQRYHGFRDDTSV